jgi:nicotinamide riboside transporter PnuC
MRYVIAAFVGIIIGFVLLAIYTYAEFFYEQTEQVIRDGPQTHPAWYVHYRQQAQGFYSYSIRSNKESNQLNDRAFFIAFLQGCVDNDNSGLVPGVGAISVLGLWTWDRQRRQKTKAAARIRLFHPEFVDWMLLLQSKICNNMMTKHVPPAKQSPTHNVSKNITPVIRPVNHNVD